MTNSPPIRLLVCGWREWGDREVILRELSTVSVPLERLSETDQEFVKSQGEHRVAPAGGGAIPAQLLQRLKAATVFVNVNIGPIATSGSGFLLKKERGVGYVVSNAHAVALPGRPPGRIHCVFHSGTKAEQSIPATVVGLDEDRDLAILKVELNGLPEPVDIAAKVTVAETLPVFILGFPFGDALEYTKSLRGKKGRRPRWQVCIRSHAHAVLSP